MKRFTFIFGLALTFALLSLSANAQFKKDVDEDGNEIPKGGCELGENKTQYWEAGILVKAGDTPLRNAVGTVPIPVNWPEQKVKVVEERHSPYAKVNVKKQKGGSSLMIVTIPSLPAGEEAEVVTRFECESFTQIKPENPEKFRKLTDKKELRKFQLYLGPSPQIEVKDKAIQKLAKEIGKSAKTAWDEIEEVYDWVQANIRYENGKLKGAVAALKDGTGDCEELSSLFIAICRAKGIPARIVWVPEHCYAEFYLVDEDGHGFWFPCQPAGDKAFGEMPFQYIILQKGDNFMTTDGEKVRYLPVKFTCKVVGKGGTNPTFREILKVVQP